MSEMAHHHRLSAKAITLRWKPIVDKLIYPLGIMGPVFSIPQVLEIWLHQDAGSVSLTSWSIYTLMSFVWILYGILHKDTPITLSYSGFFLINIAVVLGIMIYS